MKLQKMMNRLVETAAIAPGKLTPFGIFARYLFVQGLSDLLKVQENEAGVAEIAPLLQQAKTTCDPRALAMLRLPRWVFDPLTTDAYLKANVEQLSKWFNNYIKDLPEISSDEKDLFKKAVYLVKYSHHGTIPSGTLDAVEKLAKLLSRALGKIFATYIRLGSGSDDEFAGKADIDALYSELDTIVKNLTGKSGTRIPAATVKELKLKNGGEVEQLLRYNDIRKELQNLTNNALYITLANGYIPADKAAKDMQTQGFRDFPFPTSKDGYAGSVGLDKAGKLALFTNEGKQLNAIPAPGSKIKMNKDYDPKKDDAYYFLFRAPGAVGDSRGYTLSFKQGNVEEKHAKTTNNTELVPGWVKVWEKDIFNKDPMRNVPAATALILYLTSGRIGTSKENISLKGAAQTYGISTVRKSHVKVTTASIIFDYNGKKGVHQRHVLKLDNRITKRLGVIVKGLLAGKKPNDLVWSFQRPLSKQGAMQEVNPSFFNKYLKSTGVTINPHALRHIRGTELTKELLAKNTFTPSAKARSLVAKQREAEAFMKDKILTQVANLLGHKSKKNGVEIPAWRTSIQAYVNPKVVSDWFRAQQLETPKWVPSKLTDD